MKILLTGPLAPTLRDEARARLAGRSVEPSFVLLDESGEFDGEPDGVDVILFSLGVTKHPAAMRVFMPLFGLESLRWMQGPGAGVDHPVWETLLERGVRLTNASGIHSEPIAQYIFTYVLHWERNVEAHRRQQAKREWSVVENGDLSGKTLGIVGYGGIGRATARVARAFGMRVLGCRRTPCDDPALDRYVPVERVNDLLAESDYVVLCMPYSDETQGMIGADALSAMRKDAVLINVARGGVVDEPALIDCLSRRAIRGATLDVVSEEPLPEASPLWTLENCVVTPHDAGYSPLGDRRLGDLFLDNLARFVSGEPLVNEIHSTGIAR